MTEPGKALREGFAQALSGNLTYNSVDVPVFDQKVEGSPAMYVILARMSDNNRTNKSVFVTEKIFDVELYNIRKSTAQSEVLENIADQVLQIILPTPKTIGFSVTGYNVTFCRLEDSSIEEVVKEEDNRFTHAKRLTFRIRIVQ